MIIYNKYMNINQLYHNCFNIYVIKNHMRYSITHIIKIFLLRKILLLCVTKPKSNKIRVQINNHKASSSSKNSLSPFSTNCVCGVSDTNENIFTLPFFFQQSYKKSLRKKFKEKVLIKQRQKKESQDWNRQRTLSEQ